MACGLAVHKVGNAIINVIAKSNSNEGERREPKQHSFRDAKSVREWLEQAVDMMTIMFLIEGFAIAVLGSSFLLF